jgi:membrane protein implicated in regulation of membrane protease activity
MSPRTARILALTFSGAALLVWLALPEELWPQRAILALTLAFMAGTCFDRARFGGASRTESTMGPAGDALIGFQARVVSLVPLKVEARGAVWSARPAGAPLLSRHALVQIVGREGLTLLVRPSEEAGGTAVG